MTEATGIFSNSSNVAKITLIPRQSRYIISIKNYGQIPFKNTDVQTSTKYYQTESNNL